MTYFFLAPSEKTEDQPLSFFISVVLSYLTLHYSSARSPVLHYGLPSGFSPAAIPPPAENPLGNFQGCVHQGAHTHEQEDPAVHLREASCAPDASVRRTGTRVAFAAFAAVLSHRLYAKDQYTTHGRKWGKSAEYWNTICEYLKTVREQYSAFQECLHSNALPGDSTFPGK